RACGVHAYVALWNVSSIRVSAAFVEASLLPQPLYGGIVLSEDGLLAGNPGTVRGLEAMADFIPSDCQLHWSVMCVGGNLFPLVGATLERGGHIAIGLGDYPYSELGTPRNADLVERVAQMAREMGREIASPAESRHTLEVN
ncbi:MAG: 3-keto-5-aminohexanoate cleavage protein, partial [Deltaproteobacteria bacterium]|nr:3-keto-5-aminohexanoate cleavage protein [Deltaproteobacteria bacterium]